MTILDNYISSKYVHRRNGLGVTTVPWTYNDGKLNLNEGTDNMMSRL